MKKLRSNGGYALAYVVVVMTLMLAIVGGMGLTSTRNLSAQESAVTRLQSKYDAAGKMEEVYAKIKEATGTGSADDSGGGEDKATTDARAVLMGQVETLQNGVELQVTAEEAGEDLKVTVKVVEDDAIIDATLLVAVDMKIDIATTTDAMSGGSSVTTYDATASVESITYDSYTVTYPEA